MRDEKIEKLLGDIFESPPIPLWSHTETIQHLKRELLRCPCEDLCSQCRVLNRWLLKLSPRSEPPKFRLLEGGKP